jgi:hypothetical protein
LHASYPAASDLAGYLDAAGLIFSTTVATGAAAAVQTLTNVGDFRLGNLRAGDQLYFRLAQATRTILSLNAGLNQVTLDSPVTTATGEAVLMLPASMELANAVSAGVGRFEREASRLMLAGAATTRTFDPPQNYGAILNLRDDLVNISSVSYQGATQVNLSDYQALPQDAPAKGQPYNRLRFSKNWWAPFTVSQWGSIAVNGQWGYGLTIPDDAWKAMLTAAALERLPMIVSFITGGLLAWKEADVSETYGVKPYLFLNDYWTSIYTAAVARYRRVEVGLCV